MLDLLAQDDKVESKGAKEEGEELLYSDGSIEQRSIPDEDCKNYLLNFSWPAPTNKPYFGR